MSDRQDYTVEKKKTARQDLKKNCKTGSKNKLQVENLLLNGIIFFCGSFSFIFF